MIVTMYVIKEKSPAFNRQQLQKDSNVLLSIGRFCGQEGTMVQ